MRHPNRPPETLLALYHSDIRVITIKSGHLGINEIDRAPQGRVLNVHVAKMRSHLLSVNPTVMCRGTTSSSWRWRQRCYTG